MAAETIATLPRFVTFQGDNGRFLWQDEPSSDLDGMGFPVARLLRYSGNNSTELRGMYEVISADVGGERLYLQSMYNKLYLGMHPRGEFLELSCIHELPRNAIQMQAIQVASDTVGLRVAGVGYLWRSETNTLMHPRQVGSIIEDRNRMIVGEPVSARRLLNVEYDLEKAEIYDVTPLVLGSSSVTNNSLHVGDLTLAIEYSTSTESTFSNSTSVGASVTLTATMRIPFIKEFAIELSTYTEFSWEWGSTSSETTTVSGTYTIKDVAPGDSVLLQVTATRAKCHVPFSYTQRDTLPDGRLITTDRTDGIFEGVDVFHIEWVPTNLTTGELLSGSLIQA